MECIAIKRFEKDVEELFVRFRQEGLSESHSSGLVGPPLADFLV